MPCILLLLLLFIRVSFSCVQIDQKRLVHKWPAFFCQFYDFNWIECALYTRRSLNEKKIFTIQKISNILKCFTSQSPQCFMIVASVLCEWVFRLFLVICVFCFVLVYIRFLFFSLSLFVSLVPLETLQFYALVPHHFFFLSSFLFLPFSTIFILLTFLLQVFGVRLNLNRTSCIPHDDVSLVCCNLVCKAQHRILLLLTRTTKTRLARVVERLAYNSM